MKCHECHKDGKMIELFKKIVLDILTIFFILILLFVPPLGVILVAILGLNLISIVVRILSNL